MNGRPHGQVNEVRWTTDLYGFRIVHYPTTICLGDLACREPPEYLVKFQGFKMEVTFAVCRKCAADVRLGKWSLWEQSIPTGWKLVEMQDLR